MPASRPACVVLGSPTPWGLSVPGWLSCAGPGRTSAVPGRVRSSGGWARSRSPQAWDLGLGRAGSPSRGDGTGSAPRRRGASPGRARPGHTWAGPAGQGGRSSAQPSSCAVGPDRARSGRSIRVGPAGSCSAGQRLAGPARILTARRRSASAGPALFPALSCTGPKP